MIFGITLGAGRGQALRMEELKQLLGRSLNLNLIF